MFDKLYGFPYLKRVKCLLFNNNRILRISEHLEDYIPNLESLILTGNQIEELSDVEPLATLEKLTTLSLSYNFKTALSTVSMKEREEAKNLFKSKKGKEIHNEIGKRAKTFVPGGASNNIAKSKGLSGEEIAKIREAINKASSLDEVERLQKILQSGQIPGQDNLNGFQNGQNAEYE